MCFLYRQSISIVYESKFKYIYRYFIKIDRCFCGILQSLPLRKCGLKSLIFCTFRTCSRSLPLRKCGLKFRSDTIHSIITASLPLRKCGLKFEAWGWPYEYISHFPCGSVDWNPVQSGNILNLIVSLPLRKCGLKSPYFLYRNCPCGHFPCGSVDWNPVSADQSVFHPVTSLAEVWIEIGFGIIRTRTFAVTSLAEVWIEISSSVAVQSMSWPSLPLRKCGLKWLKMFCTFVLCWVTSLAEVWIEIWSSVKSRRVQGVTSLAEVWIEICCYVIILYD